MTRCSICAAPIDGNASHYVLERGNRRRSDVHLCSLQCLAAASDREQETR